MITYPRPVVEEEPKTAQARNKDYANKQQKSGTSKDDAAINVHWMEFCAIQSRGTKGFAET